MPAADLFSVFPPRLESAGLRYFATGAVAAIVYGEPRLTHDIDLVVELVATDASRLRDAFPEEEFYCPPEEVIRSEARRQVRGHFNLIDYASGFRADVYLLGRDPLHRWAMDRRVCMDVLGTKLWVAPPEYVIVRKLEFFREGGSEKHLDDIRGMLGVSGEAIDRDTLEEKVRQMNLAAEWERVQS